MSRASTIRNHVQHARPATIEGRPMPFRWVIHDEHGTYAFPITRQWLDEALSEIADLTAGLEAARVRTARAKSGSS